ncbi:TolC family protein [Desulfoferrobacter suflitae]|uniref:TolC family protein n=1 Tax=Desulfoferrobacter suflitae TaxID=2865782 RepID=UPI002164C265|nr:TolC family protein [Desulfoferrobacter suflitae]MCK8604064.1 TolC family protein [Desulfoferrobacter suflitae]
MTRPKFEKDGQVRWLAIYLSVIMVTLITTLQGSALAKKGAAAPEKKVLTLQEIQDLVLARSPYIEIGQSEVMAAKSDLRQVESAYFPQLDATLVTGPAADADEPRVENGKIIDPSPGGIFDLGIFGRIDITISQPLYTFGKLSNRREAALRGVKAKQLGIDQKRAELIFRVKQLYYAMVLAEQGLGVADEAEGYFQDIRVRIENLMELGATHVDESDLYMIDAYSAQAKGFKAEAQKGRQVAYFALKSLMGMAASEDFTLAQESLPERQLDLQAQEEYVAKALEQRPEMKQLKQGIEAQKFLWEAAKSDLYPSFFFAVIASVAGAPGRDQFDTPYFTDEFNHEYAGFFAGLQWHFDFGIQQAKVDKERAEYSKLLNTKADAEKNIPIQVANVYQEVVQYATSVKAYEEAASASRKWVVVAFSNFDMGIGTAQRIFEAIEKYGQNRGSYIEALYNYNVGLAQLEYVVGTLAE